MKTYPFCQFLARIDGLDGAAAGIGQGRLESVARSCLAIGQEPPDL